MTPEALTVRLNPDDNVVVARLELLAGTELPGEAFERDPWQIGAVM